MHKQILLTVTISLLITVASIFVYDRYFVQKIVAIDLKGYITEQRDLYLSGKINEEEFRKSIDKLEAAVLKVSKNKVILTSDVVVRNAETIKP